MTCKRDTTEPQPVAPGSCPRCGANVIVADHFECDSEHAWRQIECRGCGNTYLEVFRFSHLERDDKIYEAE